MSDDLLADDLPPTWTITSLGNVVEYGQTNKAEPSEMTSNDWVLELEDIEKDSSRLLGHLTFAERQSKSTKNRFEAGDVLYGKLRPYLNKVLIADKPGFCTTEIIPIKAGENLDPRYLFYWLKHPVFLKYVEAESHGMNMPRLGTEAGRAAPFVLAPHAEQTRIADQLDTLFARVNACNDHLDGIPGILKRFRQAVLRTAMDGAPIGPLSAPTSSDWSSSTIGAVAKDLRYGTSKKCDYSVEGTGVLRIPNITAAGGVNATDLKRANFDKAEIKKLTLRAGDLLVIRSNGSLDLVGRCGLVSQKEEGLLFAGYLMRMRVDLAVVRPTFILYWLMAPAQREKIGLLAKSTSGVNNLNAEELKSLPLRFPTLNEQDKLIEQIESLFAAVDRVEDRYRAMLAHANRLAPRVLAKAFRGELAPQDPSDEPANALLTRLAAVKQDAPAKRVKARKPRQASAISAPKKGVPMTKSRQDEDVKDQPYLAGHLRRMDVATTAEALFQAAELPVADFYKQLAWEVAQGYIRDNQTSLEPGNAAG
jgi:type I restriction enzyme S subunit